MTPIVLDLLFIATLTAVGFSLSTALLSSESRLFRLSISFPMAAGLVSWLVFLASWAGARISLTSYGLAVLLLAGFGLGLRRIRSGPVSDRSERPAAAHLGPIELAPLAIGVLAVIGLGGLSVARSYSTWDAMAIWSVKGYAIAREGSLWAAAEWGAHGLSYPLQLPLLIAAFRLGSGDVIPGSKLVFPMYFVSLLLGVYVYATRRRGARLWGAAAALLMGTVPLILEHATIGYANLPLTTLMVLGTLLLVTTGEAPADGMRHVLSGLLLGLAAWMRPEALMLVLTGAVGLAALVPVRKRTGLVTGTWWASFSLIALPWVAFNLTHGVTGLLGETARAAWAAIADLQFNFGGAYEVARFVLGQYASPQVWGLVGPLVAALALLNWRRLRVGGDLQSAALMLTALAWGLPVLLFYYLLSFRGDLAYWLGTGIDRLLMPATVMATLWALGLVGDPSTDDSREE